jgi:hypothetical protein
MKDFQEIATLDRPAAKRGKRGANLAPKPTSSTPLATHSGDKPEPDANSHAKPRVKARPANHSASADAGGQQKREAHTAHAPCDYISGHLQYATHAAGAGNGIGHCHIEGQAFRADPELIDAIREQWRNRQSWHRAEKSLTLQAKALCRRLVGGDKAEAEKLYNAAMKGADTELAQIAFAAISPFVEGRSYIEASRKQVEKVLEKQAKRLPVWKHVEGVKGIGPLMLAGIVGEAGDVGSYKSVSALWKRMGMAVIAGGRQRRVTGADAMEHGYSPARRSLMWNIGDCIIKAQVRKDPEDEEKRIGIGPLGQLYLDRKAYEADRVETKAHAHNRAKRYVEKRLLRELYAAWRGGQPTIETQ